MNSFSCQNTAGLVLLLVLSVLPDISCAISTDQHNRTYVGVEVCASCHEKEMAAWTGSHHDLAMQEANDRTVLGDFDGSRLEHYGTTTRFFRDHARFMVNTEGPDGQLHDYEIKYTFGLYPLQQYLVEFPGGRLQVLDVAWDSRSQEQGGQRWFPLHDDERIAPDDVLHWTGPNLNWNYMCAECHSTGLDKNYDADTRSYHTSWSEIDVSCEACHGPGARHIEWANKGASASDETKGLTINFDERHDISWQVDSVTGKPVRSAPRRSSKEIEACAVCHSRRSQVGENDDPHQGLFDNFIPALLTQGLYYPDGQIEDEVYVYGSFLQSRMYHAGVTCSDCHDPHAAGKKKPGEQVCYRCHMPERYASKKHHFHDRGKEGSSCIECHMPPKTYMKVDPRHDHSFRIPRPDLSVKLGTPNACNNCHDDKTPQWAAERITDWYGGTARGYQQFADNLYAGRRQLPAARELLQTLATDENQPAIARATAVSMLGPYQDIKSFSILKQMTDSTDPMQRLAAIQALSDFDVRNRVQLVFPLLADKVRSVRMQAAATLAAIPAGQLDADRQALLDKAIREYILAQEFNGERPESQLNLGRLYDNLHNARDAEQSYRTAIELQPKFVPAYVNLAQMYSNQGNEKKARDTIEEGLHEVPDSADLHYVLGLAKVRGKDLAGAVESFARAAALAPDNARYSYVHAVALQASGHLDKAIEVLKAAHDRHPGNRDILQALVSYEREAGDMEAAQRYLEMMKR